MFRLQGEEMPVLKNQLPLESCYFKVPRSVAIATNRSSLLIIIIIIIDLITLLNIYLLGSLHLS